MGKQVKSEKAKGMLVKGKAAAKPKNMEYNKKVMEKAGYSPRRAAGTAYGEVGMEKMARRHESEGAKKAHADLHNDHMKQAAHHMKNAEKHMKQADKHAKKCDSKKK